MANIKLTKKLLINKYLNMMFRFKTYICGTYPQMLAML